MTTVGTHPGPAAGTRRGLPLLTGHQFHADLLCYRRNIQSVVFTLLLPVMFLVILASIYRNTTVTVPGGTMKVSVYYVPGLIAYGVILAAFGNLAISVVRNRESGIYKRRRATPLPASVVIASRAAVAVLTALAITVVMLGIGWAAYGASIPGRTAPAFVLDVITGAVVFCCLGFAAATLIGSVDAAQPVMWVIILPLAFISGIFIPMSELPAWLAYVSYVFPVHPLVAALLQAYNPYTTGSGLNWGYLAILAAWGVAGLVIAVRRFSWLPRGG